RLDGLCLWYCIAVSLVLYFFFSSRRRHTRSKRDWSSDVCSSDLGSGEPSYGAVSDRAIARSLPGRKIPASRADRKPWRCADYGRSEERRVGKGCRARWVRYH